jgi:hypothetical protein
VKHVLEQEGVVIIHVRIVGARPEGPLMKFLRIFLILVVFRRNFIFCELKGGPADEISANFPYPGSVSTGERRRCRIYIYVYMYICICVCVCIYIYILFPTTPLSYIYIYILDNIYIYLVVFPQERGVVGER